MAKSDKQEMAVETPAVAAEHTKTDTGHTLLPLPGLLATATPLKTGTGTRQGTKVNCAPLHSMVQICAYPEDLTAQSPEQQQRLYAYSCRHTSTRGCFVQMNTQCSLLEWA